MATRKIPHPAEAHEQASAPKAPPHRARMLRKHHTAKGAMAGGIESEQRHAMIAEAAYFLSEHRGFWPGRELDDWLSAENEIDRRLLSAEPVSGRGDGLGDTVP
jgi:hypothetical protein